MQTQRLDNAGGLLLQRICHRFIGVGREQLSRFLQIADLGNAFCDFLCSDFGIACVLFEDCRSNFFCGMIFLHVDNIVCDLVHKMDRAGADVQHNGVAAELIRRNQGFVSVI